CGARPRALPVPGATLPGVCYLRDATDIARIKQRVSAGGNAVVIGGGYIGLEAAATLRKLDMQVTVVEAQDRVLQRVTTPLISKFFTRLHTEQGVSVLCASGVDAIVGDTEVQGVALGGGEVIPADLVIVGIGVLPNTELAEAADLAVDNGIRVDAFGRTNDASIYASGDCANGEHAHYGLSMRLESVQNANDQGLTVAKSINGDNVAYAALPWFWSDQYDVKLQIAGLTQGFDRQVVRGDSSNGRKFAVFYLKGNTLLAVDAINSPKEFVGSKKLILERAQMNAESLANPEIALSDCLL
ncbi:MAG: FAD-dependent oxidoreductase, partial [Pseudomonadota bacterium]